MSKARFRSIRQWLQPLWHGREQTRRGLLKLVWVIVRILLASWVWGTALRLARFSPPIKSAGLALALVSIALVIWSIWGLGHSIILIGLKRFAFVIAAIFLLITVANALTIPDSQPFPIRIVTQTGAIVRQGWQSTVNTAKSMITAPDEFSFAYSGRRKPPPLPPGFPTPDPEATPIQGFAFPANNSLPPTTQFTQTTPTTIPGEPTITSSTAGQTGSSLLEIGNYAVVVNTGSQSLLARAAPSRNADITARFPEATRVLILEGPEIVDGFTWWKVRGEQGEGWSADRWLEPSN